MALTTLSQPELDVAEWLAASPADADAASYPKLFYNVNLPPMIIRDADGEAAIGEAWRPIQVALPDVPPVTIDPASADLAADGESGSFLVTVTGPGASGTWTADKDASAIWLTVDSPLDPQTADGPVNFTAAPNLGAARSANIYVNGKTFTVNQAAGL